MTRGKNICNELKKVRRRIAEENGIPLEVKECTYKGECLGTCPRCEAEVQYLERELVRRLSLGKVATVAGLALGLNVAAEAQTQQPLQPKPDTCARVDTVRLDYMQSLTPNDQPENIDPAAIRRRNQARRLTGCLAAEVQVILGGTPANIGTPPKETEFYEEKSAGPKVTITNK